jgi:hypothetical protein
LQQKAGEQARRGRRRRAPAAQTYVAFVAGSQVRTHPLRRVVDEGSSGAHRRHKLLQLQLQPHRGVLGKALGEGAFAAPTGPGSNGCRRGGAGGDTPGQGQPWARAQQRGAALRRPRRRTARAFEAVPPLRVGRRAHAGDAGRRQQAGDEQHGEPDARVAAQHARHALGGRRGRQDAGLQAGRARLGEGCGEVGWPRTKAHTLSPPGTLASTASLCASARRLRHSQRQPPSGPPPPCGGLAAEPAAYPNAMPAASATHERPALLPLLSFEGAAAACACA